MLPWASDVKENIRFWLVLTLLGLVFLPISMLIPTMSLPVKNRQDLERLPPQLAKLILKKKEIKKIAPKPKPKKKEQPKPIKKKPKTKPKPKLKKPKIEPKKPVIKKKPPLEAVKKARKVAQKSGLLALQDELADMRDTLNTSVLKKGQTLVAKTLAAQVNTVSGSVALSGSGGINTSGIPIPAEQVVLAKRQVTTLTKTKAEKQLEVSIEKAKRTAKGRERSTQNIRRVFDQNKSALFSLYNRALRQNPFLKGKLRLELVIDPSGAVISCKVISSDLNDPVLEEKIVLRVKMFDFGAEKVATRTIIYPIDFLPE